MPWNDSNDLKQKEFFHCLFRTLLCICKQNACKRHTDNILYQTSLKRISQKYYGRFYNEIGSHKQTIIVKQLQETKL